MDEQTPPSPGQAQPPAEPTQLPAGSSATPEPETAAGFRARGRVRRRARFLRKARELAYRDLGGLVFNLHRFGQRNDALVLAKLGTLGQIDSELRAAEAALSAREPLIVLREAGVTACPRCAAIHSGEDRFCPGCGLPLSRHVDLPISGALSTGAPAATTVAPPAPTTPPAPAAASASPAPPLAPAGASGPATGAEPAARTPPVEPARTPPPPAASDPGAAKPTARSPTPPAREQPPPEGAEDAGEAPTRVFSSRAPGT